MSRPHNEGRFVHVSEVGAKLFCRPCKAVLSLMHVVKETRKGMHSTSHMKCRACDVLNKIPIYGKNSSSKKPKIIYYRYQLAHSEWRKQQESAEFFSYLHFKLNSLTEMVSGFILFSCQSQYFVIFCISSCSPPRVFLVMQRCQVLLKIHSYV